MKIRKLLVYSVIALFTIAGGYFFVSSEKIKPSTINKSQDKLEIVEVATPTPTPQPSEKALKIASFAWARMNDKQKKEIIKTYGNEASSSSEIIRQFALGMDQDSALMAQNEAKMQKITTQENRPVYYESDSIGDTNETLCQKATAKYQECMNDYTERLGDYTECISRNSGYCSSPFNFCLKPNCVR